MEGSRLVFYMFLGAVCCTLSYACKYFFNVGILRVTDPLRFVTGDYTLRNVTSLFGDFTLPMKSLNECE